MKWLPITCTRLNTRLSCTLLLHMVKETGKGGPHTGDQVPLLSSEWLTLVAVVHEQRFITLHLYGRVKDVMPWPYDPLRIPQYHLRVCVGVCGERSLFRKCLGPKVIMTKGKKGTASICGRKSILKDVQWLEWVRLKFILMAIEGCNTGQTWGTVLAAVGRKMFKR